ncbi:hypothetical protein JCM10207_002896 [Rhodosporidiobolus poonsookiae]
MDLSLGALAASPPRPGAPVPPAGSLSPLVSSSSTPTSQPQPTRPPLTGGAGRFSLTSAGARQLRRPFVAGGRGGGGGSPLGAGGGGGGGGAKKKAPPKQRVYGKAALLGGDGDETDKKHKKRRLSSVEEKDSEQEREEKKDDDDVQDEQDEPDDVQFDGPSSGDLMPPPPPPPSQRTPRPPKSSLAQSHNPDERFHPPTPTLSPLGGLVRDKDGDLVYASSGSGVEMLIPQDEDEDGDEATAFLSRIIRPRSGDGGGAREATSSPVSYAGTPIPSPQSQHTVEDYIVHHYDVDGLADKSGSGSGSSMDVDAAHEDSGYGHSPGAEAGYYSGSQEGEGNEDEGEEGAMTRGGEGGRRRERVDADEWLGAAVEEYQREQREKLSREGSYESRDGYTPDPFPPSAHQTPQRSSSPQRFGAHYLSYLPRSRSHTHSPAPPARDPLDGPAQLFKGEKRPFVAFANGLADREGDEQAVGHEKWGEVGGAFVERFRGAVERTEKLLETKRTRHASFQSSLATHSTQLGEVADKLKDTKTRLANWGRMVFGEGGQAAGQSGGA